MSTHSSIRAMTPRLDEVASRPGIALVAETLPIPRAPGTPPGVLPHAMDAVLYSAPSNAPSPISPTLRTPHLPAPEPPATREERMDLCPICERFEFVKRWPAYGLPNHESAQIGNALAEGMHMWWTDVTGKAYVTFTASVENLQAQYQAFAREADEAVGHLPPRAS